MCNSPAKARSAVTTRANGANSGLARAQARNLASDVGYLGKADEIQKEEPFSRCLGSAENTESEYKSNTSSVLKWYKVENKRVTDARTKGRLINLFGIRRGN